MPTLTVTVSDAALARLRELAADRHTTPEAVAADELERPDANARRLLSFAGSCASGVPATHPAPNGKAGKPTDPADDPLSALLGSIKTDVTDVSERHDEYIGQALYDEMHGGDGVR